MAAPSSDRSLFRLATVARNATANLARLGTGWIILLVVPPLLVRVLDKPAYATWVLILQLAAYATILEGGVQLAIARFVAQADASGDRRYMGQILSSATFLLMLVAVTLAAFTVALAWNLGRLFHSIPGSILPQAASALLVVGLSLALCLPFSALSALFLGLQKSEVNALAGSVGKIIGAAGAVWAAMQYKGLIALALWTAAGIFLQPAIYLFVGRKHKVRPLFAAALVSYRTVREFAIFCSTTLTTQLGMILISGLDLPIVAAFDFRAAAYYAIATALSNVLVTPYNAILSTIMPVASGLSAGNQAHRLGELLIRTTRYSTALLCLMALPLLAGMGMVLHFWVGDEYARHALPIAQMLVLAQFIRLLLAPYATIGFSAGQQSRMLLSPALEGVVNVLASLVLVRYFGALGVAIGTLIGALVGVTLHFFASMPRTNAVAFPRVHLLYVGIVRPLLCVVPCSLLLLRMATNLPTRGAILALAETCLGFMLWRWNFSAEERTTLARSLVHLGRLAGLHARAKADR